MLFVFSHVSQRIFGERILESLLRLSCLPDTTKTIYMADFSMEDLKCDFIFILDRTLFTDLFLSLM